MNLSLLRLIERAVFEKFTSAAHAVLQVRALIQGQGRVNSSAQPARGFGRSECQRCANRGQHNPSIRPAAHPTLAGGNQDCRGGQSDQTSMDGTHVE